MLCSIERQNHLANAEYTRIGQLCIYISASTDAMSPSNRVFSNAESVSGEECLLPK